MFSGGKVARELRAAQANYDEAMSRHASAEQSRLAALADAQRKHEAAQAGRLDEARRTNARIDALQAGLQSGDADSMEEYFQLVLERAPLPDEVARDVELAYQAEARRLHINCELPGIAVIPTVQQYRYVRTRDEIDEKPRPAREISQRYADLVAQLVLRTLRDVFDVDGLAPQLDEVAVNGHVSTRNRATGQPERPCLVSVAASRGQFAELVLTELEPKSCLVHLNALVSPNPYDLEPVRPIFDPDLSKFRIVDSVDAAAALDHRRVLLDLTPTEFEHLTRQLFEAMGMKSWVTQASRDDGVDAVAVNEDPIMGGLCVIQAKRYRGVVGADAVRALAGVMDDKRAGRGALVTTSWFGKTTHEFAARHGRIQLIEGAELKHLLAECLGLDVLIGELKRRT